MDIEVSIRNSPLRNLIGQNISTTFSSDNTLQLWKNFIARKDEITGRLTEDYFSVQVYPADFTPSPHSPFTRWACCNVVGITQIPSGMQSLIIPEGLYAVFIHKGSTLTAREVFTWFHTQWLPGSGYYLDDRPHFEIIGEKYKHNQFDSEEEIWIPVKKSEGEASLADHYFVFGQHNHFVSE